MTVGINIENCTDVRIIDGKFSGLATGININDSHDVHIDRAKFLNVNVGVRAKRVSGLKAYNCRDEVRYVSTQFQLSTVAQNVKWYIEYLRKRG